MTAAARNLSIDPLRTGRKTRPCLASAGAVSIAAWCRGRFRLWLELGIPIQVVEPALVQVVGRKQPSVAMQVLHARLERHLRRPHTGFARRHAALLEIAARAGGDHVDPRRMAAARARCEVIEREIVARAAILAGELVGP